jgi:hypothetical protein
MTSKELWCKPIAVGQVWVAADGQTRTIDAIFPPNGVSEAAVRYVENGKSCTVAMRTMRGWALKFCAEPEQAKVA